MKHFLNDRDLMVQESLQGIVAASGGRLTRLDGFPSIKVVLRADWTKDRVAIISGGGSGHEPAHAGFVGPGMLTAAVCGEVFASPSVEAVLAAIRSVSGKAGALLVVKNYTGDRLNFGLAAERARQMGHKVEMVVVGDDISLAPSIQPRGIAGTLFVHKIAGHYAELGHDLQTVTRVASEVAQATKSLGLALTTCHTPGSAEKEVLLPAQAELGLGIHGEPGAQRVAMATARDLLALVVDELDKGAGEGPFCVLINNLGAVPPLEMGVLVKDYLETPLGARTELVVGPGHLMTSYDMKGFSLSLLPLTEQRREALTSRVLLAAWPGVEKLVQSTLVPLPGGGSGGAPPSSDPLLRERLMAILGTLKASRGQLNALDAKVGDGDAGDTFANAATALEAAIDTFPFASPEDLLATLSQYLGHAGGSSGILLAIFTGAASAEYRQSKDWLRALDHGTQRLQFYGGAKLGDRTMLDVLWPALTALKEGKSLPEVAALARQAAQATADMATAGAGRSAYLGANNLTGVVDPGAEAVALALEAMA
jgi:dihydroxyacetone kinase